MNHTRTMIGLALLAIAFSGCMIGGDEPWDDNASGTDTGVDTDTDADADSDGDDDTDIGGDADSDSDGDGDADSESDTDGVSDACETNGGGLSAVLPDAGAPDAGPDAGD
jgi:hypothetical protein